MFWHKSKYIIEIEDGKGVIKTDFLSGIIQHLIVCPHDENIIWRIKILDGDGDEIYRNNKKGIFHDREGIPIGTSQQDKLVIILENVYKKRLFFYKQIKDQTISVILKIR